MVIVMVVMVAVVVSCSVSSMSRIVSGTELCLRPNGADSFVVCGSGSEEGEGSV